MINKKYIGAYSQRWRYSNYDVASRAATQKSFTVKVGVNNSVMGRVSATGLNNGVISAVAGSEVTVTATPNQGYKFVRWDLIQSTEGYSDRRGADSAGSDKLTFTVHGNCTVTAVFAAVSGGSDPAGGVTPSNIDSVDPEDPSPAVNPQPVDYIGKAKAFLKQWWWALAIAAYVIYKERKGGGL